MANSDKRKSRGSQQVIKAVKGSTIRDVIQAVVSGDITGDVHIGDKIYNHSELEVLNEYLTKAVYAYESQMYQTLRRSSLPDHPYKFLQPFAVEDGNIFFGRDACIEELRKKVVNNRLTILHARGGAGKTSLLNAGLSPRLIDEARLPISVHIRPFEENPVRALKLAIIPSSLGPWPELLSDLSMHEFLGLVCAHLSRQTQELVIIFDQFEQFLVSLPEPKVRLPFIQIFRDCYDDQTLPVRFVIALRHENLGDLDEFESYIPQILHNRYRLPLMTQSDVREAITGPILKLQREISIEPALLDALIETLGGKEVELTHLQIVCTKLYDSLPQGEKVLSVGLYQSLGEVEGILTSYLEDALLTLSEYEKLVARNILKTLVSSEATNRILRLPDFIAAIPPDEDVVKDILQYLVDKRLLRRGETLDGKEYELAHAYLAEEIFHWVGEDELVNKRAQELLQRELANWRVHSTLVDEEKLNILRTHIKYLTLDKEAQDLLFLSALEQGHDLAFWLDQVEDKEDAFEQIVAHLLVVDQHLSKKISENLRTDLEPSLRPNFLSHLWATYNHTKGIRRQNIAGTLWTVRPWLSRKEKIRVFPNYALGWSRQRPLYMVGTILLFSLIGILMWNSERPVSGQWIPITAGRFIMGMDETEAKLASSLCLEGALDDEQRGKCWQSEDLLNWSGRPKKPEISQYWILDNEVTNAQYQQCVDVGDCQPPTDWHYEVENLNLPATNLDWFQAEAYCKWLGGRLPTEGEWEKAARGPDNYSFPWGNTWDATKANLEHFGIGDLQSVDRYAHSDISGYSIKNMAGNAREWTSSEYLFMNMDQEFTNAVFIPEDNGADFPIIVRGGAWINERSASMVSNREIDGILARRETLGFRCTCPEEQQPCEKPWNFLWIWFGL